VRKQRVVLEHDADIGGQKAGLCVTSASSIRIRPSSGWARPAIRLSASSCPIPTAEQSGNSPLATSRLVGASGDEIAVALAQFVNAQARRDHGVLRSLRASLGASLGADQARIQLLKRSMTAAWLSYQNFGSIFSPALMLSG